MSTKNKSPVWLQTILIILLIINYLVLLPSTARFMKSIWSIRDETYMQARRPSLTLIFAFSLLLIIIIHPILLYLYFHPWSPNQADDTLNKIIHILVIVLAIIPLIGVALRIWLFYFAHKFTEALFKQKRVQLQNEKKQELLQNGQRDRQSVSPFVPSKTPALNNNTHAYDSFPSTSTTGVQVQRVGSMSPLPSVPTQSTITIPDMNLNNQGTLIHMESIYTNPLEWWVDNKNTWGSVRFLKYIVIGIFLLDIIAISVCSLAIDHIWISYAIQTFVYIVLLLFITGYFRKLSPFRDEFFVRKQFYTEVIIVYCNFFLWVVTLMVWYMTKKDDVDENEFNIYENNNDMTVRIIIRFLLDGNMTLTCFALIIAQFAVPWFRYTANIDRLSHRNVLEKSKGKKRLKVSLFDCLSSQDGYYLFFEYLMKEFSVENLLFITEVAYMKNKFDQSVIVARDKSGSNSVAQSIRNAFNAISDRKTSQESKSVSSYQKSTNDLLLAPNKTKPSHKPLSSGSTSSGQRVAASPSSRRSTGGNRLSKLRDIPSDGAIVTTQSEVENIMNKSADELNLEQEENKYNIADNESDRESSQEESANHSDTDQSNKNGFNQDTLMEMGVINGKRLTIQAQLFTSSNNSVSGVSDDEKKGNDNKKKNGKRTTITMLDGNKNKEANKVNLPKLPHTVTMADSMKQNNLFDSVDMIYDNFIDKNAAYQINVSSTVREQITKIVIQHRLSVEVQREKLKSMDRDHGGVLPAGLSGIIVDVHIFDEASTEILALLRSSFYRFAATKAYKVFVEAIKDKKYH